MSAHWHERLMYASLTITYENLSIQVDLQDADLDQATTLLGQACNEVLRMNLALVMQGED